jgi:hypothetical protein
MAEISERERNLEIILGHTVAHHILHPGEDGEVNHNAFEHYVKITSTGTNLPREEVSTIIKDVLSTFRKGGQSATRHP